MIIISNNNNNNNNKLARFQRMARDAVSVPDVDNIWDMSTRVG